VTPEEALASPDAIRVRVAYNDPSGRFFEGSEGVLLENDSDKYPNKVLLCPWQGPEIRIPVHDWLMDRINGFHDIYYFYDNEIEILK
jgi:hypothetical protein